MTDNELLKMISDNPSRGMSAAIEQYGGLVRMLVSRVIPNRNEDIEECTADVFVTLWKKSKSFDCTRGTLKAYIAVIARNEALDRYRRLTRTGTIELDEELRSDLCTVTAAETSETLDEICGYIRKLDEPDKSILARRFLYFLKPSEIAKALGLDVKYVDNRIFRGRTKLKAYLTERGI